MHVCAAIDSTAKREGYPSGGRGYKAWLADSMPIICGIGVGTALSGLSFQTKSQNGFTNEPLEKFLYKLVRCGLYHEGHLPDSIELTDHHLAGGVVTAFPKTIVYGLILAVISSPANLGCSTKQGYFVTANNDTFRLNECWGLRAQILQRLGFN